MQTQQKILDILKPRAKHEGVNIFKDELDLILENYKESEIVKLLAISSVVMFKWKKGQITSFKIEKLLQLIYLLNQKEEYKNDIHHQQLWIKLINEFLPQELKIKKILDNKKQDFYKEFIKVSVVKYVTQQLYDRGYSSVQIAALFLNITEHSVLKFNQGLIRTYDIENFELMLKNIIYFEDIDFAKKIMKETFPFEFEFEK